MLFKITKNRTNLKSILNGMTFNFKKKNIGIFIFFSFCSKFFYSYSIFNSQLFNSIDSFVIVIACSKEVALQKKKIKVKV